MSAYFRWYMGYQQCGSSFRISYWYYNRCCSGYCYYFLHSDKCNRLYYNGNYC